MSSTRSVPPLELSLAFSFHHGLLLLVMHATVFVSGLIYLQQQQAIGVTIILLAMISLYHYLVRRPVIHAVTWHQQSGWHVITEHADYHNLFLDRASRYGGWVCALRFRDVSGKRIDVQVFADSVDRSCYRQLLVLLRSGVGFNDATGIR